VDELEIKLCQAQIPSVFSLRSLVLLLESGSCWSKFALSRSVLAITPMLIKPPTTFYWLKIHKNSILFGLCPRSHGRR